MHQLHAYKKGIEKQADKNIVLGIGVHWASSAMVTLLPVAENAVLE